MGDYAKDVLVTTDWVAENLDNPDIRLVDVDEDTEAYERGHIRNAIGLHWRNDLQDELRRDFVDAGQFAVLNDRIGVTNDTQVVLYGGNNNWFACYAYWYYRYYGHPDVKLLDGGRKKWELEGRELTKDPPKIVPSDGYATAAANADIRALRDFIAADVIGKPGWGLVDVRSPEEYRGELLAPAHLPQEQSQKPGHIPGAANIPWGKNVNADTGQFLPKGELEKLYADEGITKDSNVVAYCRIGERSALAWFVLYELLGFEGVRNYDGSWTEWGSLVGAPIER
ncbi:MAG TPA: sulfurtransferase [Actinomycetota bacterium]